MPYVLITPDEYEWKNTYETQNIITYECIFKGKHK